MNLVPRDPDCLESIVYVLCGTPEQLAEADAFMQKTAQEIIDRRPLISKGITP